MSHKRAEKVQETRDRKFDQTQTDGKEEFGRHQPKREHRRGDQTSREGLRTRSPPSSRGDGKRREDPERNCRNREATAGQYLLPLSSTPTTPLHPLRTIILQ